MMLIQEQGYEVVNVDSTLSLQAPRIAPFIDQMQDIIAATLNISKNDVSIKATTTEKLGYIGREEGVMAQAVVLLKRKNEV